MGEGVTCVGGMVADLLARPVRNLPTPGRLELVREMALAPGGCALNTASALARLGVTARLVGKTGADGLGDYLLQTLTDRGVDVAGVQRSETVGTSASMVLVYEGGERGFVHTYGATAEFRAADIDWSVAGRSRIFFVGQALLLPGFDGEPAAWALAEARRRGLITVMDTVWDATGAWLAKIGCCLEHLDYFVPSYDEARAMTGLSEPPAIARFFRNRGVRTVGIKLAERGCYLADEEGEFWVDGFTVDAVDTTGAGDAWVGGFLAGILQGLPLPAAGRLGNAVGALCVTGLGAYAGIRNLAETQAFMAAHEGGDGR
ncbi:MAG: carbohydrate kinase family protein [Mycobacterium leprae]